MMSAPISVTLSVVGTADNVGPALPALVTKLSPMQRTAMARCLSGVDESPIPDLPLTDYLEAYKAFRSDVSIGGSVTHMSSSVVSPRSIGSGHEVTVSSEQSQKVSDGDAAALAPAQSKVEVEVELITTIPHQVNDVHDGMFTGFLAGLTMAEKLQLLKDTLSECADMVRWQLTVIDGD